MGLCAIYMCLKTSMSHSISHAASMSSIKIASSSTSWGSRKISAFTYVGHVIINSPRTDNPLKRLRTSAGSDLFQKNSKT